MKLSQDTGAACEFRDVHKIELVRRADRLLLDEPGVIGDGGNSGFQALNIAVQFGARRIILVGYDMRLDHGAHWHGRHAGGLNNPSDAILPRWRAAIDGAAETLGALGVEVLNASPVSTLSAYPIVEFEEALS